MKISNDTMNVLKNFATINSNFYATKGDTIKSVAFSKNILVEAKIPESFPVDFGIFDLNKFLATASLFKDPDFEFTNKYVTISSNSGASVTYFYADPSILSSITNKPLNMPKEDIEFELSQKDFLELQKAAAVLQVQDLALMTKGSDIVLKVYDFANSETSNSYEIKVLDNTNNLDFCMLFKVENLKFIPGNYKVKISKRKISEFSHTSTNIKYWVSLESDSVWN